VVGLCCISNRWWWENSLVYPRLGDHATPAGGRTFELIAAGIIYCALPVENNPGF